MYRTLDPEKVISTLDKLNRRIDERFPQSGLSQVCGELGTLGRQTWERAEKIARPNFILRGFVWLVILTGICGLIYTIGLLRIERPPSEVFRFFQGMEAAMNTVFLAGAALFSLITFEQRYKRRKALRALVEFRAIVHVIDIHQLTKDPSMILGRGPRTASSPVREMNQFELMRYLDYCSEMLSLTAKLAAFYTQKSNDSIVISAVNDLEILTANLSRKIWQKITMLEAYKEKTVAS